MKYFIDTEFLEGTQKENFPISLFRKNTPPTIDLISIGIVTEGINKTLMKPADVYNETVTYSREYYAISKDFNLREAWNRFDVKIEMTFGDQRNRFPEGIKTKVYWIRENVLYPIFAELFQKHNPEIWKEEFGNIGNFKGYFERKGNGKKMFKELLDKYGKTNEQIAKEIKDFIYDNEVENVGYTQSKELRPSFEFLLPKVFAKINIEFYAYYADYDWVAFCWLFGKMMDLPKGFPMYCKDLKQTFDEKQYAWFLLSEEERTKKCREMNLYSTHVDLKQLSNYPKQENEHSAIYDARWTKKLYEFLNNN